MQLRPTMRNLSTGAGDFGTGLTTEHSTRDISHDLFVETRLLMVLQTRQTIGGYGPGNTVPGLR